jgi:phosphoglucomutase
MIHSETGFYLGDPAALPFPADYTGDEKARAKAMESFILSASGWRRIFAADGGSESRSEDIGLCGKELAAAMAWTFAEFLLRREGHASGGPSLAVGIDSRFTGPAIAEIMIRVFLLRGIDPRYLFITPAPEIMAYAGTSADIDGFVYISASHNPIGYNGLKFGLGGGVLGGNEANLLADSFRACVADQDFMQSIILKMNAAQAGLEEKLGKVFSGVSRRKKEAEAAYEAFIRRVITGEDEGEKQQAILESLRSAIRRRPCGLVIDFNGSARSLGIDRAFLESFGICLKTLNSRPREIVHRIEPEGEALEDCKAALTEEHGKNPDCVFGYVPDNDGDRGNIVFWDGEAAAARIPEAQEVFALACYLEMSFLEWKGGGAAKTAIAVNDATSLRIERIASAFKARVFRAEVGEANVVTLARNLRREGWTVRILGEGSNGGTIIHPSEVRDPLSTVFALLKLLYLPLSVPGPRTLSGVLAGLPKFLTLGTSANEARLTIKTQDHGALKERYEQIFLREWEARKQYLEGFGLVAWEEQNHEGIVCRGGMGKSYRTEAERGGLTMLFKDARGQPKAFLWMRGSGTEPLFRISVDLEGDNAALFNYLLSWHTAMVMEADEDASRK